MAMAISFVRQQVNGRQQLTELHRSRFIQKVYIKYNNKPKSTTAFCQSCSPCKLNQPINHQSSVISPSLMYYPADADDEAQQSSQARGVNSVFYFHPAGSFLTRSLSQHRLAAALQIWYFLPLTSLRSGTVYSPAKPRHTLFHIFPF